MKKLLIPVVLLMLTTQACKKKNEPSNPVGTTNFKTYASMDEVFTMLVQKSKVMIFDAGTGTSFSTDNGVRYIFQPNSFIDAAGAVVTGNVQVEVTEYLKKGDMIFSGVLPVSNGEALASGGEFNVKASKNGQELFVKPGMAFQANLPQFGKKDTAMLLFVGRVNGQSSTDKVNWVRTESDSSSKTYRNIKYFGDTVNMICDSFNMWNCDHFRGLADPQKFKVSIVANNADISKITNLNGYALFDKENALVYLGYTTTNTYDVTNMPSAAVHFVVFGLINGHFYGGVWGATTKTGETYTVTLTEVDPKDFKAQINGLY